MSTCPKKPILGLFGRLFLEKEIPTTMKTSLLLCALMLSTALVGQTSESRLEKIEFHSNSFDTLRTISIFLPLGYEDSRSDSFPLLVVFDAQFEPFFGMVTGVVDYLSAVQECPPFIIVGIHTQHRPREFTPAPLDARTVNDWGDVPIGDAAILEAHLKDEVYPSLRSKYRLQRLTLGLGHSLGGTFVTQSMMYQRNLFHAIVSISPNMAYDYKQLAHRLDTVLRSDHVPRAWHFMTAGDVGVMENSFRISAELADSIYRSNPHEHLVWEYRRYVGQNHMITPMQSISEGMLAFSRFWMIGDGQALALLSDSTRTYVEAIQNHFQEKSEWLGYPLVPDVDELNGLGYIAGFEENWKQALGVFEWAIALHPNDPNIHDSKGEALENLGDFEGALASYLKAIEMLESNKDAFDAEEYGYYFETFNSNADRVRKDKTSATEQ
jgi:predicted alpha/beta superfamily hydrolase